MKFTSNIELIANISQGYFVEVLFLQCFIKFYVA